MTKSEKPPFLGVALSFGEVMKKLNYRVDWQGNVSFWARVCNYNFSQSSIKLTGLSMTTFVGYVGTMHLDVYFCQDVQRNFQETLGYQKYLHPQGVQKWDHKCTD